MTRGSATYVAKSQADALKPVWLFRLETGLVSPNDVILFTNYPRAITFPAAGSDVYASRPVTVPEIGLAAEGESGTVELVLGDVDSFWRTKIKASGVDFEGRALDVRRGDVDALASTVDVLWNTFLVEAVEPRVGQRELVLHLVSFLGKGRRVCPPGVVTRKEFPGAL